MYDRVGPEGMDNMGGFDGSQGGFGGFGVRSQLVMHLRWAHECMKVSYLLHSDKLALPPLLVCCSLYLMFLISLLSVA